MDIQTKLFQLGIPTYVYSVQTALSGKNTQFIGDTLEVTVGWVYGLSINIENSLPGDQSQLNVTSIQAAKLFLNLKYGTSIYVNQLRLDHLIFNDPSATSNKYNNPQKYLPVNIPMATDLKQSFYTNPTLIATPANVALNLFYIDTTGYENLVKNKVISRNGL